MMELVTLNPVSPMPTFGLSKHDDDVLLLQKYGVTSDELFERINQIIHAVEPRIPVREHMPIKKGFQNVLENTNPHKNNYDVDVEFFNPQEIACYICEKKLQHSKSYLILKRRKRRESDFKHVAIKVADIMQHVINEHQDFGRKPPFRIPPTQICELFNLGNTALQPDDPLTELVKIENLTLEQIKQRKSDEETLAKLQATSLDLSERLFKFVKAHQEGACMFKSLPSPFMISKNLELTYKAYFATNMCDICHPSERIPYSEGSIRHIHTGEKMNFTYDAVHILKEHNYFGDPNSTTRLDPELLVKVLGNEMHGAPNRYDM